MARFKSIYSVIACSMIVVPVAISSASAEPLSKDVAALMKAMEAQSKRMAEQARKLEKQERELENQKRAFNNERAQFEKLRQQVAEVTGKPAPVETAAATPPESHAITEPQEVGSERKAEAKDKPPEIAAVIEEGGVLLKKGSLVVTPAMEYTQSTSTRVAIDGFSIIPALQIGSFEIAKVKRDVLTPSIGLRYGLTNRFEIEAKVPGVYRQDATNSREIGVPGAEEMLTTVDSMGIGDVELGAHYQLNNGQNDWPYLIGNLRFKTVTGTSPFEMNIVNGVATELPTGTGFYALQPSLTAIYPADPVVYYGNIGYLHNFEESFPLYGKIEPGDSYSASMGMSMSLNDKSSFAVGYSHNTVLKTLQNGQNIPNSTVLQVGSLDFGYSYALKKNTNLNFTVSAGVTDDAPDVRLIVRVPMTYDLQ